MRTANWLAPISIEKTATGSCSCKATCSAMLMAKAVLPIDGRAASTTKSAAHALLPAEQVILGDLEDLETGAADCDLLITHSHGRQAAERMGKPLLRIGFPVFDRIGNAHRVQVGYRGTTALIFEIANTMMEQIGHHHATDWPLTPQALRAATHGATSGAPLSAEPIPQSLAEASA